MRMIMKKMMMIFSYSWQTIRIGFLCSLNAFTRYSTSVGISVIFIDSPYNATLTSFKIVSYNYDNFSSVFISTSVYATNHVELWLQGVKPCCSCAYSKVSCVACKLVRI